MATPTHYPRPTPTIGDATTASERRSDPAGWAFDPDHVAAFDAVLTARRDIRTFRPDPLPARVLTDILAAGHSAPSVGHSQPWRFIVITDPQLRDRAALMADTERLRQADQMTAVAGRKLRDLRLDGIKEAPCGVVVTCDRRTRPQGVLGRATFTDSDMWSCAAAIQNMWLAARARGVGMGWVTLFRPHELLELVDAPEGVETLGWLCFGYPDERPPSPGLQRAGWSTKLPLKQVVSYNAWGAGDGESSSQQAPPPRSYYAGERAVSPRDDADALLTVPAALGVIDEACHRMLAWYPNGPVGAHLVLAAGDHRVADLGVSAFSREVTGHVVAAARAGESLGTATAAATGASCEIIDGGTTTGDLRDAAPLTPARTRALLERGAQAARDIAPGTLIALGEVGIGNTTPALALAAALLEWDDATIAENAGVGAGGDSAVAARKVDVVCAALHRWRAMPVTPSDQTWLPELLAELGGPEFALLAGVVRGAADTGAVVITDGLATSVAALAVVRADASAASHLLASHASREPAHRSVLAALGVEPFIDARLRCGEGVGAVHGARLLRDVVAARAVTARTDPARRRE